MLHGTDCTSGGTTCERAKELLCTTAPAMPERRSGRSSLPSAASSDLALSTPRPAAHTPRDVPACSPGALLLIVCGDPAGADLDGHVLVSEPRCAPRRCAAESRRRTPATEPGTVLVALVRAALCVSFLGVTALGAPASWSRSVENTVPERASMTISCWSVRFWESIFQPILRAALSNSSSILVMVPGLVCGEWCSPLCPWSLGRSSWPCRRSARTGITCGRPRGGAGAVALLLRDGRVGPCRPRPSGVRALARST